MRTQEGEEGEEGEEGKENGVNETERHKGGDGKAGQRNKTWKDKDRPISNSTSTSQPTLLSRPTSAFMRMSTTLTTSLQGLVQLQRPRRRRRDSMMDYPTLYMHEWFAGRILAKHIKKVVEKKKKERKAGGGGGGGSKDT